MLLPDASVIRPASWDINSLNLLVIALPGGGKSGFVASIPGALIFSAEPLLYYPVIEPVLLSSLDKHRAFLLELQKLKKETNPYKALCGDSINLSYEYFYSDQLSKHGLSVPSDDKRMGSIWMAITQSYIKWVRDVQNEAARLGIPFICTAHAYSIEVTVSNRTYNKFVPNFVGGGGRSTYQKMFEIFKTIGFLTLASTTSAPKDFRKDGSAPLAKVVDGLAVPSVVDREELVIHFQKSQWWEAKDNTRRFPPTLRLTSDYMDDWRLVKEAYEKGVDQ